jgi:hypothetical protein
MNDDMLLLTLCDHGAMHAWFRLKWLSDVAMMLTEERPVGRRQLLKLAEQFDLKRTLAQTALLVHWVYGVPLSDDLKQLIGQEKKSAALSIPALAAIQMPATEIVSGIRLVKVLRNTLQIWKRRPSLSCRTVLLPLLTSATDYQDFQLPDRLFWLYIPLRPFFWLWRYFRH